MGAFADNCENLCGDRPLMPPNEADHILDALQKLATMGATGQINGQPMTVEVGFVDSFDFIAWAATVGNIDLIGINLGVYPMLLGAFRGILWDLTIFPGKISDGMALSAKEDRPLIPRPWIDASTLGRIKPLIDPVRDKFAHELAFGAMIYILTHELAHITNGHTSWSSNHGLRCLPDRPRPGTPEFSGLQSQTLEYDADMAAAGNTLAMLLNVNTDKSTNPATWTIPTSNRYGSVLEGVKVTTYVITIIHIFFARLSEFDHQNPLIESHPPAVVRRMMNSFQIGNLLNYRSGYDATEWTLVALDATSEIGRAFYAICDGAEFAKFPDKFMEYFNRYKDLYDNTWEELRPELDVLKRSGYLAPTRSQVAERDAAKEV